MIKGIIFDVDGTLLNSMPVWENLGELYLRAQGKSAEKGLRDILYTMGVRQGAAYLKTQYGLDQTVEEVIEGLNREVRGFYEKKVPLKEGVREYLERFRELSLPMMLATSGDKTNVRSALSRLGILSWFEGILTCLEMGTDKNHPDVFLAAALQMDLDPSEILVFEDALYTTRQMTVIWQKYGNWRIFICRNTRNLIYFGGGYQDYHEKETEIYRNHIHYPVSILLCADVDVCKTFRRSAGNPEKLFQKSGGACICRDHSCKRKGMVFRKERECQISSGTSDSRNTWCAVQFLRGRSYDPVGCVDAQQNVSVFCDHLQLSDPERKSTAATGADRCRGVSRKSVDHQTDGWYLFLSGGTRRIVGRSGSRDRLHLCARTRTER